MTVATLPTDAAWDELTFDDPDPCPEVDESAYVVCTARSPAQPYRCVRPFHVEGQHVACGCGKVLDVWEG